jgi:hypothetical protein
MLNLNEQIIYKYIKYLVIKSALKDCNKKFNYFTFVTLINVGSYFIKFDEH